MINQLFPNNRYTVEINLSNIEVVAKKFCSFFQFNQKNQSNLIKSFFQLFLCRLRSNKNLVWEIRPGEREKLENDCLEVVELGTSFLSLFSDQPQFAGHYQIIPFCLKNIIRPLFLPQYSCPLFSDLAVSYGGGEGNRIPDYRSK